MSTIQNNQNYNSSQIASTTTISNATQVAQAAINFTNNLPPATTKNTTTSTTNQQLPSLPAPSGTNQNLSLDNLLAAIDIITRKLAAQQGIDSIQARGDERKAANDEKIKQIQENLEKSRSQKILDGFMKAFQAIGALFSAIAGVASIAIGAVTGNPLMIAAGAMMCIMAVDQTISLATNGEHGIAAWTSKLFEKMGVSEDAAKWIGFGVQIAMTVATVALSGGAALAGVGGSVMGASAQTVANVASTVQKVSAVATGINAVAQGSVQIASAVNTKHMSDSQAYLKELEAIIERLTTMNDVDLDYIKELLERNEELLGDVSEIVDGINQANTAIATGAPSMA